MWSAGQGLTPVPGVTSDHLAEARRPPAGLCSRTLSSLQSEVPGGPPGHLSQLPPCTRCPGISAECGSEREERGLRDTVALWVRQGPAPAGPQRAKLWGAVGKRMCARVPDPRHGCLPDAHLWPWPTLCPHPAQCLAREPGTHRPVWSPC